MRIVTGSIEDFIENMRGHDIYRKTVYVSRTDRSISDTGSSTVAILQLSTILELAHDEQALLECGINCGIDRPSESTHEGSEERGACIGVLETHCEENELVIKPGILDF